MRRRSTTKNESLPRVGLKTNYDLDTTHEMAVLILSALFLSYFPRSRKTMRVVFVLLTVLLRLAAAFPAHDDAQHDEIDNEKSRKIIGQR